MTEEKLVHLKVFFVSGLSTDVYVKPDAFEKMKKDFEKGREFVTITNLFAIWWKMVTHYEVQEN